jgi:hypothetical protein
MNINAEDLYYLVSPNRIIQRQEIATAGCFNKKGFKPKWNVKETQGAMFN